MLLYAASSLQAAIQHNGLCVRVCVNPCAWKPLCGVWQRDLATLTPAHGHCHTGMLLDTCDHCLFTENVLTPSLDASVQTSTVRTTRIDWIHQFLIWFFFLFFFLSVRGRNYSVKVKKVLFRIFNNKLRRKKLELCPSFLNIVMKASAKHTRIKVVITANLQPSSNIYPQLSLELATFWISGQPSHLAWQQQPGKELFVCISSSELQSSVHVCICFTSDHRTENSVLDRIQFKIEACYNSDLLREMCVCDVVCFNVRHILP